MAQYAHQMGARLILFDPDHVHWENQNVTGHVPTRPVDAFGDWKKVTLPLPQAIYENVFVHLAVKGRARTLRRMAKKYQIPLFNPPLLNKWQMTHWMNKSGLENYTPETTYLSDVQQAVRSIDRWTSAYVKPIGGYGGMGVMRVEAWGPGQYRISVDRQQSGKSRRRVVVSRNELMNILRRRKKSNQIVQQSIRLFSVNGRKVDFRVVVQRGRDGKWQRVGIVPKVAAADGVVTNIIAGGERMSMPQLQALAAREGKSIPEEDIHDCAMAVAEKLSERIPHVGLIGFDLGLDDTGKTWVIEVNPKPARSLLSDSMKRTMAEHAVGFAVYLANRRYYQVRRRRGNISTASQS